ncbi:NAD(P)-dependent oxidoreductase [Arthrobacter sp. SIMBA_036]|uniref:NAD(P)-dependent oxidoreductase n=1 Tax=Arthrobacter sp. SIMBA_036 TaxID=3085778 RepID=UPI00397CDDD9
MPVFRHQGRWRSKLEDQTLAGDLKVGLIGAGRIGLPIATRISQAGFKVVVVDVAQERLAEAGSRGLETATDTEHLVGTDVVFVVVAKPSQVLEVLEKEPFVSGRMAGTLFVVVSTIGPAAIRKAEPAARRCGVVLVDCPVTGGVDRAESGDLTLFVSGASDVIDNLRPVLSPVGALVVCGTRAGDGQSFKMVNNMLAVTNLVAAAEALAFASRLGLDREQLLDVLPNGTAASWMLSDRGRRLVGPASERLDASIYLEILAKDAALVVETAEAVGFPAPVAEVVRQQWQQAVEMGLGRYDDTAIIETYAVHPDHHSVTSEAVLRSASDALAG